VAIDQKNRVFSAKGFPNLTLALGSLRRVDRFKAQFNRAMTEGTTPVETPEVVPTPPVETPPKE
jgi:hypothetical protein